VELIQGGILDQPGNGLVEVAMLLPEMGNQHGNFARII
jgi:hypothetical protein